MVKKIFSSLIPLLFFLPYFFGSDLYAKEKPYYEGKVINIIVGYAPGGGYDRITRVIAKHLPRFIPGKPSVLVQNMPGAATVIAANYIYNIAKPDGLTIGLVNRGIPFAQLLHAPGVKFDLRKFSWIGSAAVETTTLALRTDMPFKNIEDLFKAKEPIIIGSGGGPGDATTQFVILLKEFLNLNMKIVNYQSSADVILAIERKEADGIGMSINSVRPFLERKLLRCWIRGRYANPEIEKLPVDEDLTTDKTGKLIMGIRSVADAIGRPYIAPPNTPVKIMSILRDAFARALKDPEVVTEARTKSMMDVQFVPPEECLRLVNFILNQPEDMVTKIGRYIKF